MWQASVLRAIGQLLSGLRECYVFGVMSMKPARGLAMNEDNLSVT